MQSDPECARLLRWSDEERFRDLRVHPEVPVDVGPGDDRVAVAVYCQGGHVEVRVEPRAEVVGRAEVGEVQAGHADSRVIQNEIR